jgi:hypothetical protein
VLKNRISILPSDIVVLIVHKRFVVKEIFLDIQVGSNTGKYFL